MDQEVADALDEIRARLDRLEASHAVTADAVAGLRAAADAAEAVTEAEAEDAD